MDDLLTDFLTETNESLAEADLALVRLEQDPGDVATLGLIFRLVHTIKGTCGFLGLVRLEKVAHAAENVLGRVRDGALAVAPDLITAILTSLDRIKSIVAGLENSGREPAGDDAALIAVLDAIYEGRPAAAQPQDDAESRPARKSGKRAAPSRDTATPEPAAATEAAIVETSVVETPVVETQTAAANEPAVAESGLAGQTIRVGVDVLENLMTLVSELVLTRNQLLQLARNQENAAFTGPLQRLSHIVSDLQEGVMKTRMQPIGIAWNKLPRIVRDLTRELGKKIDLTMLGADTELDRQVLELIKDPLTHMVRNSGDHGLETPAERRAAGKPETGRITLNAYHEGGHIVVEIADDGRGLPVGRIRAKALANGLASEAELAAMSDEAIHRFIFHPGLSTASTVTAVSGRGVGMDVVKTNIEKIGGTIELKSRPGEGTSFTIKIPLTLAIVAALIVQSGGERFAIPQISVVELVRAREGANSAHAAAASTESVIERVNDTPVLRLRERLLPLVSLDELLGLPSAASDASSAGDQASTIVVAQVGAAQLGLIVDRVFDTEEIVVKPVAPVLRHIGMFSGNTILGDGSVIMILDPNGIAKASGVAGGAEQRGAARLPAAGAVSADAGRVAMLLFKAGDQGLKAVPLSLVARLEQLPQARIEFAAGAPVTQYRGRLMRLLPMSGRIDTTRAEVPVLVFSDHAANGAMEHRMGLVADEIVDVVEDHLRIELSHAREGILGTAIIAGRATDVIDTSFWLTSVEPDWFDRKAGPPHGEAGRILVVEDSDFFRQMIVPVLQAAGYRVTAVPDATRALALRDAGQMYDVIISDIEMPDMDGLAFVRAVRTGPAWNALPVIALSGRLGEREVEAGRDAGFTDYVGKGAKEALLQSLRQCLSHAAQPPLDALQLVA
jgi:two-component system, chemotaxis family, sensor kinase CheA